MANKTIADSVNEAINTGREAEFVRDDVTYEFTPEGLSSFVLSAPLEASLSDLTTTWNDAGTTFSAIKMDVTDTASANASMLLDLRVGGVQQFFVGKTGRVRVVPTTTASSPAFGYSPANNNGIFFTADGMMGFSTTSSERGRMGATGFITHFAYQWSQTAGGTVDLKLERDTANALALRNGTSAQAFRVYNTYTSSTDYERLGISWASNVVTIAAEAQTGTVRPLMLKMTPQTVASLPVAATAGSGARMFVSDATAPTWGATVAGGGAVPCPVFSDGTNWKVG